MLIRSLLPSERELYRAHLLRLSDEDRFTRFCGSHSDDAINDHVTRIDFSRDHIKVAFDPELNIIAAAHLCVMDAATAEFSLSVEPPFRHQGWGRLLFKSAITWMTNVGIERAYCSCLRSNGPMLHIAVSEGMAVVHDDSQVDAYLQLEKDGLQTVIAEIIEEQIGWIDFAAKYLIAPNTIKYFCEKYGIAS
jgi:GNAT superfamily N-acetyltransferase